MKKRVVLLLVGLILTGVACSSSGPSTDTPDALTNGGDPAGESACSRFRDVAAGAFGETLSESEVVSGLEEVGSLAEESTNPAIRDNAQEVAAEANAQAMISGEANSAQDALAEACNEAFPI